MRLFRNACAARLVIASLAKFNIVLLSTVPAPAGFVPSRPNLPRFFTLRELCAIVAVRTLASTAARVPAQPIPPNA